MHTSDPQAVSPLFPRKRLGRLDVHPSTPMSFLSRHIQNIHESFLLLKMRPISRMILRFASADPGSPRPSLVLPPRTSSGRHYAFRRGATNSTPGLVGLATLTFLCAVLSNETLSSAEPLVRSRMRDP